jgi:hypothetical protein
MDYIVMPANTLILLKHKWQLARGNFKYIGLSKTFPNDPDHPLF